MHLKTWTYIIAVGLALSWSQEAETKPLPVVQIAIVEDGSSDVVPEFVSLVQQEIREVTSREFDVRFPNDVQLQGGWSAQGVKQALDRVLSDRRINVVIALGFLATSDVSQRKDLPKPVIAPVALDPHLQGLPLKKGASGIKNLHYLTSLKGSERNLTTFKEIFPFTRLSVLIDGSLLETTPSLESRIRRMAEKVGVEATIIPVAASAETALNALPPDTEAVYVSVLPRVSSPEFARLAAGLIERRLPSFSSLGQRDVDRGIAVALSPDVDVRKLARTVAANVQRILSGTDAGQIEVAFARGEHLTINMATVRAIDKWPSFQVLTEADLLNEDAVRPGPRLSLFDAVRQAMEGNLDLAAANRKVEAGRGAVGQARSDLLPQVLVGTAGVIAGRGPDTFGTGADPGQSAIAAWWISTDSLFGRHLDALQGRTEEASVPRRGKKPVAAGHWSSWRDCLSEGASRKDGAAHPQRQSEADALQFRVGHCSRIRRLCPARRSLSLGVRDRQRAKGCGVSGRTSSAGGSGLEPRAQPSVGGGIFHGGADPRGPGRARR